MEHEPYDMNIESWANSIIELEENTNSRETAHFQNKVTTPSSLVSLGTPTYYRSKAFSSTIGINNLINAADPLLTLVTQLRKITLPPDIQLLHQNICHEIRAFENKAQTLDYHPSFILAARYVLCALLDELITITLWPDQEWKTYSFVDTFHKDSWEEDRFYMILERSLQEPTGHLDLLELIYISLRLGYEGKYRSIERGYLELRNITDHLYVVITQQRDEFSRSLLISLDDHNYLPIKTRTYSHLLPPAWLISTLMVFLLLTVFIVLYFKLIEAASPINKLLNSLHPIQELTTIISSTEN